MAGNQHYLTTLGIPLVAGRNFDPGKVRKDSAVNEFIVNEAFLRRYMLNPDQAVGKQVILGLTGPGTIIGVAKDFHISSMHDAIQPIVLFNNPQYFGSILLRVGPGNISAVLKKIESAWHVASPARPFNYSFLDEQYDSLYRTEQRLGVLMSIFCGTAILVTCLGLLGLMAFVVSQRTKEIGIRKVLGASVLNITTMLSTDLLRLVMIAILIACPVAWYCMHHWLQDFAYRIGLSWYLFAMACIATIVIAMATISFQAIKAAVANPVKSLRNE
jgi:putative ABC transport system permease protein